jgi:cytidylate kinase
MPDLPQTITIDGPAGSGKSTLAQRLADRLGYLYFDTGVMYRAVTWAALAQGIEIADEAAVTALAERVLIDVRPASALDGRQLDIMVDGKDITWATRSPEVEANVSPVSAYPGVRKAMLRSQREIGLRGKVVMAGRDIGTVVLPEADLKIYLEASEEARAERRYREQRQRDPDVRFADVLLALQARDRIDSTRRHAPLRPAEDALILDTTSMDIAEVEAAVMRLVQEGWRRPKPGSARAAP